MASIDVPHHYEHAPRVQQGIVVRGTNNWYLGAKRIASPIVHLKQAPDYDSAARAEWEMLPGQKWGVLPAESQPAPREEVEHLVEPPASAPPPAPAPQAEPPKAVDPLEGYQSIPVSSLPPNAILPDEPAPPPPKQAPAPSVPESRFEAVPPALPLPPAKSEPELPPAPPVPPEKLVTTPALIPEKAEPPKTGDEYVEEAYRLYGVLPK